MEKGIERADLILKKVFLFGINLFKSTPETDPEPKTIDFFLFKILF